MKLANGGSDMATETNGGSGVTVPPGSNLTEVLRNLPFQLSGRYAYNGGASLRQGRSFVDTGTGTSAAALENPLYRLDEPVYLESPAAIEMSARSTQPLRFTLHVDIDGTDPLGAVSGTVALGAAAPGEASPHFIGRVASDETVSGGRLLTVSDVKFRWPDSTDTVTRLTVELSGSPLAIPTAKVTFHASAGNRDYGPYVATQGSIYFREVEMDVDREVNAVECEPLDTHIHPDRPADGPQEILSLESAFAKAGIRITRSPGSGTVVNEGAGDDKRWSYSELHDSMEKHWEAFANKPQWKMWIFLAELGESDGLGGVMFDGEIDEPGGVDRQGTAIFTRCPYFHTAQGGYIQANPPAQEAIRRELFFNLMHETGHAFNLAHSFQKEEGEGWVPPAWMPLRNDPQALSWMNYPDAATPGGSSANASWFYRRFRFRFDPGELLFLRHAPETYVEMGGQAWFEQHGRVARISLDPRLELILRSRKTVPLYGGKTASEVELGEPVLLELRLRNAGGQPVLVHGNLDPSDGLVEIAVTNPKGERRPFLPIDHTRTRVDPRWLQPDERLYQNMDLTMGSFGFPFKEPGPYRVEASYRNLDGGSAAAVLQIYVRPAGNPDIVPVVNELYDARVGRTLYVEGTRVMEDVNDKLDWVCGRLGDLIGEKNPISIHLRTVRYKPLAKVGKLIDPTSRRLVEMPEEPDVVVRELKPVVVDQCEQAADTMGHIWYEEVVKTYARAAEDAQDLTAGREALEQGLKLFQSRGVVQPVLRSLEERIGEMGGSVGRGRSARRSAAARSRS
jgi:hypothetical protein